MTTGDLCTGFDDDDTSPTFLDFSFTTIDKTAFPPGDYTITITGTVGSQSETNVYTVTFVDPCPTATVTFASNPFAASTSYALKDPDVMVTTGGFDEVLTWDDTDLLNIDVLVDCGAITFVV